MNDDKLKIIMEFLEMAEKKDIIDTNVQIDLELFAERIYKD